MSCSNYISKLIKENQTFIKIINESKETLKKTPDLEMLDHLKQQLQKAVDMLEYRRQHFVKNAYMYFETEQGNVQYWFSQMFEETAKASEEEIFQFASDMAARLRIKKELKSELDNMIYEIEKFK